MDATTPPGAPADAAPPDAPATGALPCLHVCVTCRAGTGAPAGDEATPGRRLHDAVAAALAAHPGPPVTLRAATCLAACDHGCAAAMQGAGKWGYLLGRLTPDLAGDLVTYGAAYAASASGAVLPSRRPASLRHVVLGRIPALSAPLPLLPETAA
ncbi:DUF1636 domain-containing protein [Roseomonas sp. OT10]|uniref:DUF1636 domain-containing protein n=1 Tax=Roseomonas cutis TaxID=2897332 RepID=UPI001E63C36B|nr:DUF1636 domain-containing protein [Roseomonas sp. OT10]UFN47800.1 DUF1636 domain-containing protein [Roseomonas sp. OT10]